MVLPGEVRARGERYRFTEWDDGKQGAELYDYSTDPNEYTNLVKTAGQEKVVAQLKQLLRARAQTGAAAQ